MGIHTEEDRLINLPKSHCEERMLALGKKKYELKKHVHEKKKSMIVLLTKTVFVSKEQRITITLNEKDEKSTEVMIRSEMISNTQVKDHGENQKKISALFNYLEGRNSENQVSDNDETDVKKSARPKSSFFSFGKEKAKRDMCMMATYLGGHKDLDKSLRGNLEIYSNEVDFTVVGPRFRILPSEIKKVTICSSSEIVLNSKWQASLFKEKLEKDRNASDREKEKKNKIVIDYVSDDGLAYCIFRAEGQFEVEKSLQKAQDLINNFIK
ncbi:hypothetical protein [Acetobacterium tundrae]|uniref:DUF4367 domain-containing protein n=1 Tax=Acetobacterium tundrae TaxID=132932 RepID=A0ABR6WMR4_9FIRM|nr:hypothetical protein [Acetobacterium tundrae]MBC3797807.1 hypothetical protein [Acetobacterium tundrae]